MAGIFRYTLNGNYRPENSFDVESYAGDLYADLVDINSDMTVVTANFSGLLFVAMNDGLGSGSFTLNSSSGVLYAAEASVYLDFSGGQGVADFTGGDFGDVLIGGDANDILRGGGGDDILEGGLGGDAFDGGAGIDTVSYEHASGPVHVYLDPGGAANMAGEAVGDTFTSIENIRGSAFDDTLVGDAGNNVLEGGAGGDDFDGGAGIDTVSYEHASSQVRVYLDPGGAGLMSGDASGDTFLSIENIRGSAHDDILVGDGGNNVLEGGGGADYFNGDGGFNTVTYIHSASGVTVDLSTNTGSGGDAEGDYFFANVQGLRGSRHDDVLTGDSGANTIDGMGSGGPNGDSLYGLGGDDRLIVRDMPAVVDGGDDFDTVVVAAGLDIAFVDGILVDVEAMALQNGASVDLSALTATPGRISASGDATIIGTNDADRIILSAGTHSITSGGGADVTFAGTDADTFVFDEGWGRDAIHRIDTAADRLDLSALGLDLDDLTVRTASNGLDTLIYATDNTADWIVLKGILLDKASMPDGFLVL